MRAVVPFMRWHYRWLDGAEPGLVRVGESTLAQLEHTNAWTGMVGGDVVFCAGTVMQWPGRHTTWALLSTASGRYMRWITREVRAGLDKVQGRIELTVRADFSAGQRWAEMLGFRIETSRLEQYGPEGEDHIGYVRIN